MLDIEPVKKRRETPKMRNTEPEHE
jgi:hypothetical protein